MAKDNPYCQANYIARLDRLKDPNKRARLYLGLWEYDDDPTALLEQKQINNLFTNSHISQAGQKYIIADIARFGSDRAVIMVWYGFVIKEIVVFDVSATTKIQNL